MISSLNQHQLEISFVDCLPFFHDPENIIISLYGEIKINVYQFVDLTFL